MSKIPRIRDWTLVHWGNAMVVFISFWFVWLFVLIIMLATVGTFQQIASMLSGS